MDNPTLDKIDKFFSAYRTVSFKQGEIITQGGSQPAGVLFLIEGQVIQYDILENGNEAIVNSFQYPAFFPMSWAITHALNRYFYEAHTEVVAKQAPPEDVVVFIKQNPDVMFDLLTRVYRGTEGVLGRLTNLMSGRAISRARFELLNAAHRFGVRAADDSLSIPLSEVDLAKRSGLARETVSRSLRQLKQAGIISIKAGGGSIYVKSLKDLEAALESHE